MRKLICSLLLATSPLAFADIVVGQSAPLTGGNAELGNDIRNGALAYFKKINDAGGIGGSRIKLVTLDDKNDTKLSAENTKKLVEDEDAVALFGYAFFCVRARRRGNASAPETRRSVPGADGRSAQMTALGSQSAMPGKTISTTIASM